MCESSTFLADSGLGLSVTALPISFLVGASWPLALGPCNVRKVLSPGKISRCFLFPSPRFSADISLLEKVGSPSTTASMPQAPPLSQGFGYGIVLGLGFAFAFGMILTTWILKRYQNEVQTSESMLILNFQLHLL